MSQELSHAQVVYGHWIRLGILINRHRHVKLANQRFNIADFNYQKLVLVVHKCGDVWRTLDDTWAV